MKNTLPKIKTRNKKRIGRGYGSGKGGHTVGRGQKGQKSRGSVGILFEGVKTKKSLLRRLPLQRGKGKFKARPKPFIIKTDALNVFPNDSKITIESLIKAGLVDVLARKNGVKILGGKKLEKKISTDLPLSKSAARQIESAGGKIV